ncbi:hypothetical protein C9I90_17040 [Photobacterium aphoticum]|nr:hypothetical protein C9I90_17040 [Photobacterium aphoticum]
MLAGCSGQRNDAGSTIVAGLLQVRPKGATQVAPVLLSALQTVGVRFSLASLIFLHSFCVLLCFRFIFDTQHTMRLSSSLPCAVLILCRMCSLSNGLPNLIGILLCGLLFCRAFILCLHWSIASRF